LFARKVPNSGKNAPVRFGLSSRNPRGLERLSISPWLLPKIAAWGRWGGKR
jgi:hypothetical protein